MTISLSEFIRIGGVPSKDYFYVTGERWINNFFTCVADESYLNRNVSCTKFKRLRRKLFYDHDLGKIPTARTLKNHQLLYWGREEGGDFNLESIRSLFKILSRNDKIDSLKYTVILGATDQSFSMELAKLIPDCISKIFVVNCNIKHPKVHWLPIGADLSAEGSPPPPLIDKEHLVYCNFSSGTHPVRNTVLEYLANKDFITTVKINGYGHYTGYPMTISEYLGALNKHKFSICPRGTGYDTYRLWDSLHLGVIPIVVREAQFHEQMANLPILFLDKPEDYNLLTKEFLCAEYERMQEKSFDYKPLLTSHWLKMVSDSIHENLPGQL